MAFLFDANVIFPANCLVQHMNEKFINLTESAIRFATKSPIDNTDHGGQLCRRLGTYFNISTSNHFNGL